MPAGRSLAELAKSLHELSLDATPASTSTCLSLLKACIHHKQRGLPFAKHLQAQIAHHHIPLSGALGDHLVLALAKCGSLPDALFVSAHLPRLSVLSGTALVCAYTDSGSPHEALSFFQYMQEQGIPPSSYTIVSLLKACGIIQDLEQGMVFHANAMAYGFVPDGFVYNTLISMYGRCGAILDAEYLFYTSSERDIVSWNAMLSAYVEHDQIQKALQLYVQMQDQNVTPDRPTYVTILKACSLASQDSDSSSENGELDKVVCLEIGRGLHGDICASGFAHNIYVNCTLIRLYGKCGALTEAENVFTTLLYHDVVSCSALLSVYVEQGHGEKALHLFRQMLKEGISSDMFSDILALQACGTLLQNQDCSLPDREALGLEIGQALHAKARREGFESDSSFHTSLVSLYGKCGGIGQAFDAFLVLQHRDVATWNALLCANLEYGNAIMTLHLYVQMQQDGVIPNQQTFVLALQACVLSAELEEVLLVEGVFRKVKALSMGKALHYDADNWNFTSDIFICNTVLNMFVKSMALAEAEAFFCSLPHRNVVSWSTLLSGYAEQEQGVTALRLYRQMQEDAPCSFDEQTFVITLQACISLGENRAAAGAPSEKVASLEVGRALHADACRKGFSSSAAVMGTLACMYSKCGTISEAESMFVLMMTRCVNPRWSIVLPIYVEHSKAEKALLWYMQMQAEGKGADRMAIGYAIQACVTLAEQWEACNLEEVQTRAAALEIGRALHADACRQGFISDLFVTSSIISMYGKCGSINESEEVFEGLPEKTSVVWNAMLSAYVGQCLGERVIAVYQQMVRQGVTVDEVTLKSALQGSSLVGDLDMCQQLHFDIVCAGFEQIPCIVSCLFHAYGDCASMIDAQDSFSHLSKPDIVSWNACIAGHVREGNGVEGLYLFEELRCMFTMPSKVSYLMILSACGHAGLLLQGFDYYISMRQDYNCNPEIKHYGSLLGLLGRAGDFRRLENLLGRMPVDGNVAIWSCLLGACCTHSNFELALQVFHHAVHSNPEEATAYVLLSNVCANVGLQEGSAENSGC